MPLVPALGRQKPVDFCKFKASPVYKASLRTDRAIQRNPVSKKKKKKKKKNKGEEEEEEEEKEDSMNT
jgi:hypothetical protein